MPKRRLVAKPAKAMCGKCASGFRVRPAVSVCAINSIALLAVRAGPGAAAECSWTKAHNVVENTCMLYRACRLAAGPAKEALLKKAEEAEAKALWARSKAAQLARLALTSPPPEGPVTPQPVTSSARPPPWARPGPRTMPQGVVQIRQKVAQADETFC